MLCAVVGSLLSRHIRQIVVVKRTDQLLHCAGQIAISRGRDSLKAVIADTINGLCKSRFGRECIIFLIVLLRFD